MLVGLALSIANFEPTEYIAGLCAKAHQNLNRTDVSVNVQTVGIYSKEQTVYDLAYDRAGFADLTIRRKRPFRVVVERDRVVEFDPTAHQFAEKLKGDESLENAVRHATGVLDELVASLIEPRGVGIWLRTLKFNDSWTMNFDNGRTTLSSDTGDSHTRVVLDTATHLLDSVSVKARQFGTSWKFSYAKPRDLIAFHAPADAHKVSEIKPEIVAPTYASARAKVVCEKVFDRYDHVKGLAYSVTSPDEAFEVWIDGVRARQRDSHADWVVNNKSLLLLDKAGRSIVDGNAELTKVVDAVSAAGTRVEPLLSFLLRGINPFRYYMGQNANVKATGSTKVNGDECSILQVDSPNGQLSIVARDRDGFVLSLMMIPKGSASPTSRNFKPLALTPETFRLAKPEGWASRSLEEGSSQPSRP